jgi:hypothetical protein
MAIHEQDVVQITSMGFPDAQAREALGVSNGSLEMAVNYLLGGGAPASAPVPASAPAAAAAAASNASMNISSGGLVRCSMSQYSVENGRSACTCIALTAASQFLQNQDVSPSFLETMISQGVQNYQQLSTSSSSSNNNVEHMSAEEVLQKDQGLFQEVTSLGGFIRQGILSQDVHHPMGLKSLLEGLRHEEHREWMCVLITKTPETVLLCFPPDDNTVSRPSSSSSEYWLIDSHPRPHLGLESAYATRHASLDSLLMSLHAIFPCTDLGPDVPEMMAVMYNSFDLYPLILKK